MTNKHTRDILKAFREEFGIHFKNAPDELIFACVFLEEALREERAIVLEEIEKWRKKLPREEYMPDFNEAIATVNNSIIDLINKLKQK